MSRTLTADEIRQEVTKITTQSWPWGQILPLKNYLKSPTQWPIFGVLWKKTGEVVPVVYEGVDMFDDRTLTMIDRLDEIKGVTSTKFASFEALVTEGWIVD